jgi:hypothetical protein
MVPFRLIIEEGEMTDAGRASEWDPVRDVAGLVVKHRD